MEIIRKIKDWGKIRKKLTNLSMGFVPTMGALHEGHLSLIRKSKKENRITVVSIFVNPTQFNDKKDFRNYPNTIRQDIEKLEKEKVDFLFLPDYREIYPDGYTYKVTENQISKILCGAFRPGHFDGVLTVVMKLLNIINADRAYFGEKDFQQYLLVKGMVNAFFMKTKIIPCRIIREKDKLAMSSRNLLLNKKEREIAPLFYKILSSGKSIRKITRDLKNKGFKVDYVQKRWGRIFGAVYLGNVRLIDNVKLKIED